jgi:hypothetical protein
MLISAEAIVTSHGERRIADWRNDVVDVSQGKLIFTPNGNAPTAATFLESFRVSQFADVEFRNLVLTLGKINICGSGRVTFSECTLIGSRPGMTETGVILRDNGYAKFKECRTEHCRLFFHNYSRGEFSECIFQFAEPYRECVLLVLGGRAFISLDHCVFSADTCSLSLYLYKGGKAQLSGCTFERCPCLLLEESEIEINDSELYKLMVSQRSRAYCTNSRIEMASITIESVLEMKSVTLGSPTAEQCLNTGAYSHVYGKDVECMASGKYSPMMIGEGTYAEFDGLGLHSSPKGLDIMVRMGHLHLQGLKTLNGKVPGVFSVASSIFHEEKCDGIRVTDADDFNYLSPRMFRCHMISGTEAIIGTSDIDSHGPFLNARNNVINGLMIPALKSKHYRISRDGCLRDYPLTLEDMSRNRTIYASVVAPLSPFFIKIAESDGNCPICRTACAIRGRQTPSGAVIIFIPCGHFCHNKCLAEHSSLRFCPFSYEDNTHPKSTFAGICPIKFG